MLACSMPKFKVPYDGIERLYDTDGYHPDDLGAVSLEVLAKMKPAVTHVIMNLDAFNTLRKGLFDFWNENSVDAISKSGANRINNLILLST